MYVPYYNKFFGRIICQNIKAKIIRENSISYDIFKEETDKVRATNGSCDKDYLFTPDGEYCYKCDSENSYGMPGCKGKCSFSKKRDRALKCEGECKDGYIESSEGVCSPCQAVSKGCYKCHYDTEYPFDYIGIKRKRRFVCDYCEGGFIQAKSGECLDCEDLGLSKCTKCELNPLNNQSYICINCIEGFFVNETGQCQTCDSTYFQEKKKCIKCSNNIEGGIDNCKYCKSDGDGVICNECISGYILLTNNNSCLDIGKNKELQQFLNCNKLTMENNELRCSKCKERYTLVNTKGIKKCIYIKSLFDKNFEINYENYFYTINNGQKDIEDYIITKKNDYIYKRYKAFLPCQEAENLGKEDNPLYSCTKCYERNNITNNYISHTSPVRITEENSNVSYCISSENYEELYNCTEAIFKIKKGRVEYNCKECIKNYVLTRNRLTNNYYCQSMNATTKCIVLFCKTCNPFDGYICEECLPDYSINSLTGSCVKNTDVIPAVTWKDIYRLNMNGVKEINNRNIYGPSLTMRGITNSQINTGHAFMIFLTFQIKHGLRNLEGENDYNKIPAICEILNEVEKTDDDVTIVEYDCIGNQTADQDLTDYTLGNIEEEGNDNSLKKTNLKELVTELKSELGDLGELQKKQESIFTFEDLLKIVVFTMDTKIKNITADNYNFKFQINGQLNKDIATTEPISLKRELELAEVDNNTKANCVFNLRLNKVANLSCNLNVENHKDIKTFSFKTSTIYTDNKNNEIYLASFNDITLINSEKKESKDDNNNDKTIILIIIIASSVVGAALIALIIYCLIKRHKAVESDNKTNKKNNEKTVQLIDINGK